MRSLRRRPGHRNEPPFLRGQVVGAGQASGLVHADHVGLASPLRDSAGITPASLCTAPAQGSSALGCGKPTAAAGARRAAVRGRSAMAEDAIVIPAATGTNPRPARIKAPPSHTWRGPRPLSGRTGRQPGSDTPATSSVNWRRLGVSGRPLVLPLDADRLFRTTEDKKSPVPFTNCNQRVTRCALQADNQTDAGGVGTPELTSRRHTWRPAGVLLARAGPAGLALRQHSTGGFWPACCRAGSAPPRPRPVAFGI